ncbi:hypothetical protein RSAG8_03705, partial [Rhizoctonia solani AG-8 WAC10335]
MLSSNPALTPLILAVRDIVRVTQASSRKEWLEFGQYVKELIDILLRELERNQALRNGAVSQGLRVFQW